MSLSTQSILKEQGIRPWYYDPQTPGLNEKSDDEFVLIPASSKDCSRVQYFYSQHPVDGYELASVELIVNPTANRSFHLQMRKLNNRANQTFFGKNWQLDALDPHLSWRKKIYQIFEELSEYYTDPDYPYVRLLPLWHGAKEDAIESICIVGYVNAGTTDAGFFGNGIYFSVEADYAYRVYSLGALFLNWIAIFSPFPFIPGDNPSSPMGFYDARVIPVVPRNPSNQHEVNFDACPPNTPYKYIEVVVQESSCLPRYLVKLQPIFTKTISSSSSSPIVMGNPSYLQGEECFSQGDYKSSVDFFKEAAEIGHPDAQYRLGMIYQYELLINPTNETINQHIYECISAGKLVNSYKGALSSKSYYSNINNINKAIKYYQDSSAKGHAGSQCQLGICYLKGAGLTKDIPKAIKYFQLSKKVKFPKAYYHLGICYREGRGVEKSDKKAIQYLKQAADLGYNSARTALGLYYQITKW